MLNGNLTIRTDIAALPADIAKVEARVEAGISDLLKWVVSALIAQDGLIVALVTLL